MDTKSSTAEKVIERLKKRYDAPTPKQKKEQPMNPLSDFLRDNSGNAVPETEARIAKASLFYGDERTAKASKEDGHQMTLGKAYATIGCVDRIGGSWYIQRKFTYDTIHIDDKDMVLFEKLDQSLNTCFEFYNAKVVHYDNFGAYIHIEHPYDFIVAKCDTDAGSMYHYGRNIQEANINLGFKMYNEYKDIIHQIACRDMLKSK